MKNKIILLLALFVTFAVQAQSIVLFKIQPNGTFLTEDGKDYQVVEFEGKTAQELYDMVLLNAKQIFNDPQDVITGNEPLNISINAKFDVPKEAFGPRHDFVVSLVSKSFYVLSFRDGRVKVDAPCIDQNLYAVYDSGRDQDFTLAYMAGVSFDKKGNVKERRVEFIKKIEAKVNGAVEALLGIKKHEDW